MTELAQKLAPPRSLRDEGEDSQRIWNVIVKRYPKAAPLLCEMDVVIERAENLVRKFRTASYTNDMDIETPSLAHTSSSDDSIAMMTAISSGTQMSTSEENFNPEEVGTRMSDDCISKNEDRVDLSSFSSSSDDPVAPSSTRKFYTKDESINTNIVKNSMAEKSCKINEDTLSSTSQKDDSTFFEQTKEVSILEERKTTFSDIKATKSTKLNDKKDDSNYRPDYSDSPDEIYKKISTKKIVTKVEHSIPKKPSEILNETIVMPIKVENIRSTSTKIPRTENSLRSKKLTKSASEVSPSVRGKTTNIVPIVAENIETTYEKESHHENSSKVSLEITPVTILKNYAKQCNEKLDFNVIRNKPNSCEIECSFAGYSAKSMSYPKSSVETKVATLILRKLAEDQMDEKDMKKLLSFTTEQMRYVIALGTDGQPENAIRKLYKLCVEKNAPKPTYSVCTKVQHAPEGVKKIVKCTALNKYATGSGVRTETAKIAAAETLYTELLKEQKQS